MSIQKIKNHYSSVGSYLVSAVFSSRTAYTEKIHIHMDHALPRNESLHERNERADHRKKQLKRWNTFLRNGDNLALRKLVPREAIVIKNQCATRKAQLPSERERECVCFLEFEGPHPPLETAISKFVMKMLRHCDQDERESDGSEHWDSVHVKFLEKIDSKMGQTLHTGDWRQAIYKGSNKTWFE